MPAEWEPHEATWLAWPHERTDWPGKFAPIPWIYGDIVRRLARVEKVRILVQDAALEKHARRVLTKCEVDLHAVEFFRHPTNRSWTRDYCPIFVRNAGGEVAITNWLFNGWAKYDNWKDDNKIPSLVARKLRLRQFDPGIVLEGGSIDVNGAGGLLTTEECLLSPVQARNPGMPRAEIEGMLREYLGVERVVWLRNGIAGDDTHGHVDDVCRFVSPGTVVLCRESDPRDVNYRPLAENRERLEGMRLEDGSKIEVVDLPMPAPLYFAGQRLPASYANFYIANAAVLVPTFNDPQDRVALGILAELVKDRPVVGVHAVDLVWGLGTIHCLTQQEPEP